VGVLSPLGVLVGVALANAVSERALELSFPGCSCSSLGDSPRRQYSARLQPVEILDVSTEDRNGLVHVALVGELDLSTVAKVQDELRKVEATSPPTMVVDLSKLTFLDSTGLRCIITADERAREEGRRMVIVRGPDPVQRVFSITRLEERLEIVDDAGAVR
jgi:anti-sigma B factor antagonist